MFILKPLPGGQNFEFGMSLATIMVEMLKVSSTLQEVKAALKGKQVLVNGAVIVQHKFFVGLFDTLEFPSLKKHFRIVLNQRGKLVAMPISAEESKKKVCKVIGKTYQPQGKVQLNLNDGYNLLLKESETKVADSILMNLPDRVPETYLKLEKDAVVYLTHGAHRGLIGKVVEVKKSSLRLKIKDDEVETLKSFAIVVGKGKPAISVVG